MESASPEVAFLETLNAEVNNEVRQLREELQLVEALVLSYTPKSITI